MSLQTKIWLCVGVIGQAIFTARFLVQWLASERQGKSVIPVAFWWLSVCGGITLLAYALYREDPVFVVGQSIGVFVYVRNLILVDRAKRGVKPRRKPRQRRKDKATAVPPRHRFEHRVEGAAEGTSVVS